MRGKAPFRAGWGRRCGITPAYAGKRQLIPTTLTIMWDHPRLCGEKAADTYHPHYHVGSPPPMRGKGVLQHVQFVVERITPAYAGKSHALKKFTELTGDHPRLCGEKTKRGGTLILL